MPSGDRRTALGGPKAARPHPAEPTVAAPTSRSTARTDDVGLVMLCVRVAPSLRRRLKLASATSGESLQGLVTDALEAVCKRHDM